MSGPADVSDCAWSKSVSSNDAASATDAFKHESREKSSGIMATTVGRNEGTRVAAGRKQQRRTGEHSGSIDCSRLAIVRTQDLQSRYSEGTVYGPSDQRHTDRSPAST